MEIVKYNETFKRGTDGKLRYHRTKGIVKWDDKLYVGSWLGRQTTPSKFTDLEDPTLLGTEDRGPLVKPGWTLTPPDGSYYTKTPDLSAYEADVESMILREVETYEMLKAFPHPHIARYYSCREKNGRVSGLCLEQCVQTLGEKVDPGHLNKFAFLSSGRPLVDDTLQLDGIRSAVAHLHSLGLVHNDIAPSNILIAQDGRLVLGDFDSSSRTGKPLNDGPVGTKRTHEWHDPNATVASEKNDLDALDDLQTWLFGSSVEDFLFK